MCNLAQRGYFYAKPIAGIGCFGDISALFQGYKKSKGSASVDSQTFGSICGTEFFISEK